jgi:hypothetical protein
VCGVSINHEDIKYHTMDTRHVFCGAECSLKYHEEKRNATS